MLRIDGTIGVVGSTEYRRRGGALLGDARSPEVRATLVGSAVRQVVEVADLDRRGERRTAVGGARDQHLAVVVGSAAVRVVVVVEDHIQRAIRGVGGPRHIDAVAERAARPVVHAHQRLVKQKVAGTRDIVVLRYRPAGEVPRGALGAG